MLQEPGHGENGNSTLKYGFNYLIALGANLTSSAGPPQDTLKTALERLVADGAVIRGASAFYHTPAFPPGSGPDYVNAVASISANWAPDEMLKRLHKVEAMMGRVRTKRWAGRTLDLDMIACGDAVLPDLETYRLWHGLPLEEQMRDSPEQLVLPHPRLQDRAFVLVPLADVAPEWVHPVLGTSVKEMLTALPAEDLKSVRPI
ncbi:2-amino-4-hydroxy-6-hydroxymethyldihydropteridine diphosphokinase [Sulfitobacter aestuariivivens]|uniref:2-amino-4-hydroxy-6-hydroxymethyldihydropteridine pyrophosphokinase n=1 Tax=Sulfitobacter aestuariivivens TaxID=2766981 RepID=A0A927HFN1_9RHOB|nr:2-amino-4-hydroxy-6-hydroxymethyldihydropteridine diphosphokinase [Sulfitobacter aestuariivivens]MBD3664613.1 2-amino-4-hydroxy-6-hydroxymethyldihydropteridine diphosphokinase [Sulfitobacter aestuariivivens]